MIELKDDLNISGLMSFARLIHLGALAEGQEKDWI